MTMIQLYQIIQQHEYRTFDEKFDFFESTLLNNFVLILYQILYDYISNSIKKN